MSDQYPECLTTLSMKDLPCLPASEVKTLFNQSVIGTAQPSQLNLLHSAVELPMKIKLYHPARCPLYSGSPTNLVSEAPQSDISSPIQLVQTQAIMDTPLLRLDLL